MEVMWLETYIIYNQDILNHMFWGEAEKFHLGADLHL